MNWQKVRIGSFLFERKGRYKPDDERISGLKRISKIDFSGNLHIAQKPSRTKMILIKPGDLVVSGINVSKGAMGIYNGEEDVVATIHYSSYTFDSEKIDLEYFKRFLKSAKFIKLLKEQVKGGIKTEIKPKHILPLEIDLPEINGQSEIVNHFQNIENEDEELKQEINNQQSLLKKLRQQILQEAIEGKLTKDWRKENPDVEPASELLKRIKAEKEQLINEKKIRKQKKLPPITDEEKPFEIPETWEWCRLGDICYIEKGNIGIKKSIHGIYPLVTLSEIRSSHNDYQFDCKGVIVPLISSTGHGHASMKRIHYQEGKFSVGSILCCIHPITPNTINMKYLYTYLDSFKNELLVSKMTGAANVSLKISSIVETPIPFIDNQIQNKFEDIMKLCDKLEKEINQNKEYSEKLMQAVLREAFEGS